MRSLLRSLAAILLALPALAGGNPAAVRPRAAIRGAIPAVRGVAPALSGAGLLSPADLGDGYHELPAAQAAAPAPAARGAEEIFAARHPGTEAFALLEGPFAETAGHIAQHGTVFSGAGLMEAAARMVPQGTPNGERVAAAIAEILSFIGKAPEDAEADSFVTAIADAHAQKAFEAAAGPNGEKLAGKGELFVKRGGLMKSPVSLPGSPLKSGEYWDVASGTPELVIGGLDEGVSYRFIDISPFMTRTVNAFIAKLSAAGQDMSNVRMEEGDAMALKKPEAPLAAIRAKNVIAYVPEFAMKLAEMSDWIAPGGAIHIQNDPGIPWRRSIMQAYTPLAIDLLMGGWTMDTNYAVRHGTAYDLLSFKKPAAEAAPVSRDEATATWQGYIEEAAAVSAEEILQKIRVQFAIDAFPQLAKVFGMSEILR